MTPDEFIALLETAPDEGARNAALRRLKFEDFTGQERQEIIGYFNRAGQVSLSASIESVWQEEDDEARSIAEGESAMVAQFDEDGSGAIDNPDEQLAQSQAERSSSLTDADIALAEMWGGQIPTASDERELMESLEAAGVGSFSSWEEFYESGLYQNPQIEAIVNSQVQSQVDPGVYSTVTASGEVVQIRQSEWENVLSSTPGVEEPGDIGRYVRAADVLDVRDAQGKPAWQPLVSLLSFNNAFAREGVVDTMREKLAEADAIRGELRQAQAAGLPSTHIQGLRDQLSRAQDAVAAERARLARNPDQAVANPGELARAYNDGMGIYQDPFLSFFHAIDEGLAARMANAYDPDEQQLNLSREDQMLMASIVTDATGEGVDPGAWIDQMIGQGYGEAGYTLAAQGLRDMLAIQNSLSGGGGGGAQRVKPDPVAVKQSARDLYRTLFLDEPDEGQVESLASAVMGAIDGAPDDQNVDANARIRQALEGLPEYQDLYGNKSDGLTEAEYRTQFELGQQSMLGNDRAGNVAVKQGMRSGKYQTAVGAAMGTSEAWDNSTFLGRLARASDVIDRKT